MIRSAAKNGDAVVGVDNHLIVTPGQPPTLMPLPFQGKLVAQPSSNVFIERQPAATMDTVAINTPHVPPPGSVFQHPPANKGKVAAGSPTVFVGGKGIALDGDPVQTCNDPTDLPNSAIISASTVFSP